MSAIHRQTTVQAIARGWIRQAHVSDDFALALGAADEDQARLIGVNLHVLAFVAARVTSLDDVFYLVGADDLQQITRWLQLLAKFLQQEA